MRRPGQPRFVPSAAELEHVRRTPNAYVYVRNRPLVRVFAWIGPYDVGRIEALLAHRQVIAFAGGETCGALLRAIIRNGIPVTEERAAQWRDK